MTQTQTFQPTFLQKLLGRNYKWWYISIYFFKQQTHYRLDSGFFSLNGFLSQALIIFVWYLNVRNGNGIIEANFIITYLWFGNVFRLLTPNWSDTEISNVIFSGEISNFLMYPTSYFWYIFSAFIGKGFMATSFLLLLPNLLLFIFIKDLIILPNNFYTLIFLILSVPASYFIRHATNYIFGSLVFWTTRYAGLSEIFSTIFTFLTGMMLPLSLLPKFIEYNPFAFVFYQPAMIFLEKYTPQESIFNISIGIAWCIILYFLASFVFKMGLKRNESVGL